MAVTGAAAAKEIDDAYSKGFRHGEIEERNRIRLELETWLIGRVDPKDAGIVNGRRITDEIRRICP